MIHLVFEQANVAALQKAIDLDESLQGDIIQIKDDFAVGPLGNIYQGEGMEARKQWWRDVLAGGDYDGKVDTGEIDDLKAAAGLVGTLRRDEEATIWIWMAQNKHDVCSYYWLLHFMKEFQGRVFVLYMNNLPFINEKGGIFYPTGLFQILPREFLKAKKLARPITASEFEVDPDEWKKLCADGNEVRLLEGGKKLISYEVDYYDNLLKKYVLGDFQKASKIISQFLSKETEKTGDAFLLWRLKGLIEQNGWEVKGEVKNMKDFELKNPNMPSFKKKAVVGEEEDGNG
ncbi:MAG: DUF1835 domain-containing protein [Chitinophagaceae bacterium]